MENITIYYHIACMNGEFWKFIFKNQISYFRDASVKMTVLGSLEDKAYIIKKCESLNIKWEIIHYSSKYDCYEHPTILFLSHDVIEKEGLSIYLHMKGVSQSKSKYQMRWRNYINVFFLRKWRKWAKALLESDLNCCGPLFLEDKNRQYRSGKNYTYFAGNSWMAKNTYLRTLQSYEEFRLSSLNGRFSAESWVGEGQINPLLIEQEKIISPSLLREFLSKHKTKFFFLTYLYHYRALLLTKLVQKH